MEPPNKKQRHPKPNKDTAMKNLASILCIPGLICCALTARAEVKLPPVISDHMVLQRRCAAPIWGCQRRRAGDRLHRGPDEDGDGRRERQLEGDPRSVESRRGPHARGEGYRTRSRFSDVLVGEVWLGSGQSNMDMHVGAIPTMTPCWPRRGGDLSEIAAASTRPARAGKKPCPPTTSNFPRCFSRSAPGSSRNSMCPSASWSARSAARPRATG